MDSERSRWQVVIDSSSQRKSYVSKKELKIRIEEALSSLGKTTNHEKIMKLVNTASSHTSEISNEDMS